MSKIVWDASGERFFETGIEHGVLFVANSTGYNAGVAWNGLTSVSESPDGADITDFWADNIKYASMRAAESFKGSIEAYTYPDEFESCDGSAEIAPGVVIGQQERTPFAFSYCTKVGDDKLGTAGGAYKLHIVYNCTVSPSEKSYETVNDSPDAITFSWDFESTPVEAGDGKVTSVVTLDSRRVPAEKMKLVLDALYGTDAADGASATDSRLLTPSEIKALVA